MAHFLGKSRPTPHIEPNECTDWHWGDGRAAGSECEEHLLPVLCTRSSRHRQEYLNKVKY